MALTIEQIQANITAKADAREIINQIADYIQANPGGGGGGSSYLVYTATFTQSGTSDPVVNPLINTIGEISWSRGGEGVYTGTLSGAFTEGKTFTGFGDWNGSATSWLVISDEGGTVTGYYTIWWLSANQIQLLTTDENFAAADFSAVFGATKVPIKIEVYP